jgi:hypothetical protein
VEVGNGVALSGGGDSTGRPRFFADTNVIDEDSAGMSQLRTLHRQGIIEVCRSSAMDRDLDRDPDRTERQARAAEFTPWIGVWVLGESRLGIDTRLGSSQEAELWDALWTVVSPGRVRASTRRNHRLDALHLHTAITAGAVAFVTRDGEGRRKGLLDRADAVFATFGLVVCVPERAAEIASRCVGPGLSKLSIPEGPA